MANQEHLNILKKGVSVWNKWRKDNPDIMPDLSEVKLWDIDLQRNHSDQNGNEDVSLDSIFFGINLSSTNMRKSELIRANLFKANFRKANLEGSDFRDANLFGATFSGANLNGTMLLGADLRKTDFMESQLIGTVFGGANLWKVCFSRSDLTSASLGGSILVEADFTDTILHETSLSNTNLTWAYFRGADLQCADLTGAHLLGTDLRDANLEGCNVYGISVWDLRMNEGTRQSNLVITAPNDPTITIDNIEVAQFIYLILNNEKIRHVIDTITSKVVLILGRFSEEQKPILDDIRESLRNYDRVPMMFDFEKPASRDTVETVKTLAGMARFIIADITDPRSIPQELESIVKDLPSVPVVPLLRSGEKPWGMFDHVVRYPWVLEIFYYDDRNHLQTSLPEKVIQPAEMMVEELRSK